MVAGKATASARASRESRDLGRQGRSLGIVGAGLGGSGGRGSGLTERLGAFRQPVAVEDRARPLVDCQDGPGAIVRLAVRPQTASRRLGRPRSSETALSLLIRILRADGDARRPIEGERADDAGEFAHEFEHRGAEPGERRYFWGTGRRSASSRASWPSVPAWSAAAGWTPSTSASAATYERLGSSSARFLTASAGLP